MPHALDMRKICGNLRDLWATTKRTMLKNRQNVFVLPRISQISTDTMRGAFIKKTRISPMRTDGSFHGLFTLAPLPTAWF